MTIDERSLDEAIQHAREVAKHKRKKLDECNKKNNYACKFCIEIRTCKEVAEEQEQLVELLEELKALKNGLNIKCDSLNEALEKGKKVGYNKALDDFVKALQEKIEKDLANPDLALECKKCGIWKNYDIEKIAEQLKAGVKE